MEIKLKPIGIVHSPYKKPQHLPENQKKDCQKSPPTRGELEIFKEFEPGLKDLEGFSHIYVLFNFHKSPPGSLDVHPPADNKKRGVFATRSPHRPNPIGLTIVKLIQRKHNILQVEGIDMLEGTPILDIKPYLPGDIKPNLRKGWLSEIEEK